MKEAFFQYGTEGGGETLYRHNKDGEIIFYTEGRSGGILDEEEIKKWKHDYKDFNHFWNSYFTQLGNWYYFHPVFIHPDIRDFIKAALQKIQHDSFYKRNAKHSWQKALNPPVKN